RNRSEATPGRASAVAPVQPAAGGREPDSPVGSEAASPGAGARAAKPVLAVVSDLFFVSRIRETGKLTGVAVEFARTTAEVEAALARGPRFALVDLTAGFDYDRILETAEVARVPVLGFTTHARAREDRKSTRLHSSHEWLSYYHFILT